MPTMPHSIPSLCGSLAGQPFAFKMDEIAHRKAALVDQAAAAAGLLQVRDLSPCHRTGRGRPDYAGLL
jgi:hypothetical protein